MMKMFSGKRVEKIPIKIVRYNTFLQRLRGLMFRIKPIQNEGIWLEPCNSIHMFFMFFSIDVVFLSTRNEVVAIKENVRPWSVIFPIRNAHSTLELPVGTIRKYSFRVGNVIEF